MTAEEQQQDDALNALGSEMSDLRYSGELDFDAFKAFFHRAIAIIGPGDPNGDMEMFCSYAREKAWWDWMIQELQKAPSSRVA